MSNFHFDIVRSKKINFQCFNVFNPHILAETATWICSNVGLPCERGFPCIWTKLELHSGWKRIVRHGFSLNDPKYILLGLYCSIYITGL